MQMGTMNGSFDGVANAQYFANDRPTKTVFKPDSVRFVSTHWVFKHEPASKKKRKIPTSEGMLLHFRMNFDDALPPNTTTTRLQGIDLEDLQWRAREATRDIFGETIPPVNSNISSIIEKCNAKWRKQGCKVPLLHCREELENAEEWVFMEPSDDSHYRI
ncbi:hypothetical protein PFISCL1PPCAC_12831, partial [Pristionchus fissidentatus]